MNRADVHELIAEGVFAFGCERQSRPLRCGTGSSEVERFEELPAARGRGGEGIAEAEAEDRGREDRLCGGEGDEVAIKVAPCGGFSVLADEQSVVVEDADGSADLRTLDVGYLDRERLVGLGKKVAADNDLTFKLRLPRREENVGINHVEIRARRRASDGLEVDGDRQRGWVAERDFERDAPCVIRAVFERGRRGGEQDVRRVVVENDDLSGARRDGGGCIREVHEKCLVDLGQRVARDGKGKRGARLTRRKCKCAARRHEIRARRGVSASGVINRLHRVRRAGKCDGENVITSLGKRAAGDAELEVVVPNDSRRSVVRDAQLRRPDERAERHGKRLIKLHIGVSHHGHQDSGACLAGRDGEGAGNIRVINASLRSPGGAHEVHRHFIFEATGELDSEDKILRPAAPLNGGDIADGNSDGCVVIQNSPVGSENALNCARDITEIERECFVGRKERVADDGHENFDTRGARRDSEGARRKNVVAPGDRRTVARGEVERDVARARRGESYYEHRIRCFRIAFTERNASDTQRRCVVIKDGREGGVIGKSRILRSTEDNRECLVLFHEILPRDCDGELHARLAYGNRQLPARRCKIQTRQRTACDGGKVHSDGEGRCLREQDRESEQRISAIPFCQRDVADSQRGRVVVRDGTERLRVRDRRAESVAEIEEERLR